MELNNRPGYSRAYKQGKGADLYRRSLYTFWKRTVPSPMLKTFDAPGREFCTIRRSRTNTPLQALVLLNGPQYVEAARRLGERMITEGGRTLEERITYGFRLVTARKPVAAELAVFQDAWREALKRYSKDEAAALLSGWQKDGVHESDFKAGDDLGDGTVESFMRRLFKERSWGDMAASETYAHLEHLRILGRATRDEVAGQTIYRTH